MGDVTRAADSYWGDLMATSGELWWPSAARFVSAYEENLMAADSSDAACWIASSRTPAASTRNRAYHDTRVSRRLYSASSPSSLPSQTAILRYSR